jgi:hypothetical protein
MRLVVLAATLRQDRQRAKLWLLVEHTVPVHEGCRRALVGNTQKLSARVVKVFETRELLP